MLVFSYKQRIEQIWDGWLTVSRQPMSRLSTFQCHDNLVDLLTLIETQSYCCCRRCCCCCCCCCSPCAVSLLFLLLRLSLLCAVIVTCCIAKLTQGGLLYGGDHPGRCGKPRKHSADHRHTEGLDCGHHRLQPRSPSWWGHSLCWFVFQGGHRLW